MKTIKNKVVRLVLSISLASILLLGVASSFEIWGKGEIPTTGFKVYNCSVLLHNRSRIHQGTGGAQMIGKCAQSLRRIITGKIIGIYRKFAVRLPMGIEFLIRINLLCRHSHQISLV